jgi:hypothetical protein
MTFKTPTPAEDPTDEVTLTFNAQGTASSSDSQTAKITNGTIQITSSSSGQILYTGRFVSGTFRNNTNGGSIFANGLMQQADTTFDFTTYCSIAHNNPISVDISTPDGGGVSFGLEGPVECSSSQGGGTITQPTSTSPVTGTTTTLDRDSDGDGIPDSSDRCTHNSNPRCFKEGAASPTTTTQQQQPSTSSSSGNQTR